MKSLSKTICLLSLLPTLGLAGNRGFSQSDIVKKLGWVDDPLAKNLCQGYYRDTPVTYKHGPNSQIVDYRADSSRISKKGVSELHGHVKITQGQRQLTANQAILYRNPKTNRPKRFSFSGGIEIREPGGLIYAKKVSVWLKRKAWDIEGVLYRFAFNLTSLAHSTYHDKQHKVSGMTVWGQATQVKQEKPRVWDLYNATYTTCKPDCNTWHLKAGHIHLDKKEQIGTAKNTVLYIKGVPVFWFPYLRFPLTDKRTSGILAPSYGTSSSLGVNFDIPIYWNMAPNYDMIITPMYSGKRGAILKDYFRYLTQTSTGNVRLGFTPNDNAFKSLRNKLNQEFSGKPRSAAQLRDLNDDSNTRYYLHWDDHTQLNQHLFAKLDYTHVSDDYYMADYFYNPGEDYSTLNQLNQELNVDYYATKWRLNVKMQHYQTLHPLTQADVQNQYNRLPQITFNGTAGYQPYGIQFSLQSSFTDFTKTKNPFDYNIDSPTTGDRINVDPTISYPLHNNFFFFKPSLQFDLTGYHLQRPNPGADKDPSRALPIFDIDSGMYFDRNMKLFGHEFIQTLEPHIYYLYVPYRNQNNLPLFDTVDNSLPLSFNYDQMFVDNRFSDLDRIGDANQVTLAMTTQFRDANTGRVKAYASLGDIYYFRDRKVLACTNTNNNNPNNPLCPGSLPEQNTQDISPLAGQLSYNISSLWNVTGDIVYNPKKDIIDNQTYALSYNRDNQHLLNFAYTYARNADSNTNNNSLNSLEQASVSGFWPINRRWKTLGEVNYSLSRHRFQSYLYGVEYDSCCWAFRAVINRAFVGLNPSFDNNYDNRFYLQFALNGLTSIGTHDPDALLTQAIDHYHDRFGDIY